MERETHLGLNKKQVLVDELKKILTDAKSSIAGIIDAERIIDAEPEAPLAYNKCEEYLKAIDAKNFAALDVVGLQKDGSFWLFNNFPDIQLLISKIRSQQSSSINSLEISNRLTGVFDNTPLAEDTSATEEFDYAKIISQQRPAKIEGVLSAVLLKKLDAKKSDHEVSGKDAKQEEGDEQTEEDTGSYKSPSKSP